VEHPKLDAALQFLESAVKFIGSFGFEVRSVDFDFKISREVGADFKCTEIGTSSDVALQGVSVAVGHKTNTDLFVGQPEMKTATSVLAHPATKVISVIIVRNVPGNSRGMIAKTESYSVAAIAISRPIDTTNNFGRPCACDQ